MNKPNLEQHMGKRVIVNDTASYYMGTIDAVNEKDDIVRVDGVWVAADKCAFATGGAQ